MLFLWKTEDQISKLVAGPRVHVLAGPRLHICDECNARVTRTMLREQPPDLPVPRSWLEPLKNHLRELLQKVQKNIWRQATRMSIP